MEYDAIGDLVGEGRAVETNDERLRGPGSMNERLKNTLPPGRIARRTFLRQAMALGLSVPAAAAFLASFEGVAETRAFQATPEATLLAPPPFSQALDAAIELYATEASVRIRDEMALHDIFLA